MADPETHPLIRDMLDHLDADNLRKAERCLIQVCKEMERGKVPEIDSLHRRQLLYWVRRQIDHLIWEQE